MIYIPRMLSKRKELIHIPLIFQGDLQDIVTHPNVIFLFSQIGIVIQDSFLTLHPHRLFGPRILRALVIAVMCFIIIFIKLFVVRGIPVAVVIRVAIKLIVKVYFVFWVVGRIVVLSCGFVSDVSKLWETDGLPFSSSSSSSSSSSLSSSSL